MDQRPSTPVNDVDMYGMGANTTGFAVPATPQGAPTPQGPLTPICARSLHTPDIHDDNNNDGALLELDFSSVTPPMPQASVGMRLRPNLSHGHSSKHDPPPQIASSFAAPKHSEYPQFADGDVVIVSPAGRTWTLHSMILGTASPRLRNLFNNNAPHGITRKLREEGYTIRWKLLMCPEDLAMELDPNSLQFKFFKCLPVSSKPCTTFTNTINDSSAQESYTKVYDNLFRCFYSLDPQFTNDIEGPSEAKMYILDASALLQAAVYLGCVHKVGVTIEAHLLRLNQLLWHHISNKPEVWVHLASRLQSPLIFREAMLHVVGKFHLKNGVDEIMLKRAVFGDEGSKVWNLIVKKARELKEKKLYIERHLLEYYPSRMVHKEDEGEFIPGRDTYANDIYLWMALSLFRQYVSTAYLSNFHHRASDGGLSFYRTIGSADATYLRQDTLKRFNGSFDMSSKGKACLAAAVDIIKMDVKPIVASLLVDRSQATRNPNSPRLPHLTCTEILDHELPWHIHPSAPVEDINIDNDQN